jgi:hypothetical protein
MNKEFVPYEQALELKELGFDEPCFKGYTEEYKTLINISNTHTNLSVKNTLPTKPFTAPLYQQAFRWFREKYGLEGTPQRADDFMWYKWIIHLYNENGKKYVANWYEYNAYEEAELECLKKLIEIVKNK